MNGKQIKCFNKNYLKDRKLNMIDKHYIYFSIFQDFDLLIYAYATELLTEFLRCRCNCCIIPLLCNNDAIKMNYFQ